MSDIFDGSGELVKWLVVCVLAAWAIESVVSYVSGLFREAVS